jgi:hypothetical protein
MSSQSPMMMAGVTPIYQFDDGSYGWLAGFDIDSDGAGGNAENDPDWQPTTSLRNADGTPINSRLELGAVAPGSFIKKVPGIVLGCRAQVTDVIQGVTSPAVVFDSGPDDKAGEGSIALANFFGVNSNPRTGGTQQPRFFWQVWPGQAGHVGGKQYILQKLS